MTKPLAGKETSRLNAFCQYQLIGTTSETAFNELAGLAAQICGTPIALICLVEGKNVLLKGKVGLESPDITKVLQLSSIVLSKDEVVVVPDTTVDERFTNIQVVQSPPYIRFYAGVPIITPQGQVQGTLCVIDYIPRELNLQQLEMLETLSRQVMRQIEQQRDLAAMTQVIKQSKQTEQKLQESQIRLQLLNSISTRVTAGVSVDQVIEHTVKQISEYFTKVRVAYSTIDDQNITVIHSIEPPGMPLLRGSFPLPEAPEYVSTLRKYKMLLVENLMQEAWLASLADALLAFGNQAMLDVPLRHSDSLVGLLCFDSPEPHQWSEHEIATLTEVAQYLSFALKEAHAQQQRFQAEAALKQQHQQEYLLRQITQEIRRSLSLEHILNATVTEIRHCFQAERVVVYCYQEGRNGLAIAQSYQSPWSSSLDFRINRCWLEEGKKFAQQGNVYIINDIEQIESPWEFRQFLAQQQVQSGLIVSIRENNELLGIVAIYQCSQPRHWKPREVDLLEQIATQVAIAIQQGKLYQQVQQLNINLEQEVARRTAQLEQALNLEATLKQITDQVRDSLDEAQILHKAVEQLALALEVDCCRALVYPCEQSTSTRCYEQLSSLVPSPARIKPITEFPEIYQQLLQQQYFQCSFLTSDANSWLNVWDATISGPQAILVCLILDTQGVLGELRLVAPPQQSFNDVEIRLVQQVANQCAIALRQARLYQKQQQQAEELEKLNNLKDDFLSTVSHELRSPLTNIKMALKMLEMSLKQIDLGKHQGKIPRYLQILQDESERELNLINDLLDLSRLEAGGQTLELTNIDLQSWLPQVIEPFIARANDQEQLLVAELPAQLPPLISDQNALERILGELLNNACKYTPAGEKIRLSAQAKEGTTQFQVSNSGVEIAAGEISQIFDKFYRIPKLDLRKHGGTGLGLALVKKLVEHLGGTITAESFTAQTIFTVQLPRIAKGSIVQLFN